MTTLLQRKQLIDGELSDFDVREKIKGAAVTKASAVIAESTPSQARLDWANSVFMNPNPSVMQLFNYLIGAQTGVDPGDLATLTDTAIQNQVDTAVDKLYP